MENPLLARLARLRAELLVFRAAERVLAERVRNVERRIRPDKRAAAAEAAPAQEATALEFERQDRAGVEQAPAALRYDAHGSAPDALDYDAPAGARPSDAARPEAAQDVAAPADGQAAPEADAFERMGVPAKQAVSVCLKQLLGEDFPIDVSKKPPPVDQEELAELFSSLLLDDSDRDVGVILINARAAAELGGMLLGLPESAVEEQLQGAGLSTDTLEATSEVCNNLSGVVNRAAGCHVHSRPLEPADAARLPWLAHAGKSSLFSTKSGAAIWIVAR